MNKGKTIWIWNHYATGTFFQQGGRHHWFAKHLQRKGYRVKIFCAATRHGSEDDIKLEGELFKEDISAGIDYIFVKARAYEGNGISRILNMMSFYHNVQKAAKEIAWRDGAPDVVLASSVHPLTLVAGIRFGKKYKISCVCEVRDLWPESIVAYSEKLSKKNLFVKFLYRGERWIYERADALIFTMEGGKDYIIEQGWDQASGGKIDLNKVHYINNGVDLESFYHNLQQYDYPDLDLDNTSLFKVVYAGSIRFSDNVGILVDVAQQLRLMSDQIRIIVFGKGDQLCELKNRSAKLHLDNIVFKGHVEKCLIPNILSKSDLLLLHASPEIEKVAKYGICLNKMFEYFSSGKPILSDIKTPKQFDLITKYGIGISIESADVKDLYDGILHFFSMDSESYNRYCKDSSILASRYDFSKLTSDLAKILGDLT